ncbi:MAG: methyltransferase domain-containing protein [Terriglobales bacterium]|jgi:ubiquinone/menaquinone biosynthesis C-methylase UbiE|nr:methyltransferase domain-containing protein [Terriglobales bacterium]
MKRVATAELLDTDSGTPSEIAASLDDLQRINRWFGGIATTENLVGRVAEEIHASSLSVLEVAAGSGYVPEVARQRLQRRGLRLQVTLLDRASSHLSLATRAVVGDALSLPFGDESFDLVSCNLFTHHLNPEGLAQFVDEALRVCRVAVLINDLVRNSIHMSLVYAGMPLYRSRITRHDAPASVRQAYTPEEMRALLERTRAARVEIHRHYLFRMGVVAWKHLKA